MKRFTLEVDIDIDFKFFALLPAININIHSRQLEFEWLCLGIYIGRKTQELTNTGMSPTTLTGLFQFYLGRQR